MHRVVDEISAASPSRPIELALYVLCASCEPTLSNPTAPETASIEASYDTPTGIVAANFVLIQQLIKEPIEAIQATNGLEIVENLFDDASQNERVAPSGEKDDPTAGARLLAVARIEHICRGPVGDDVVDPKQHGKVTMIIKGSPRGIFPTVWGRFEACVDHSSAGAFTLDGDYSITLRREENGRSLLFVFDGSIEAGGSTLDLAFDFRVRDNGMPELRVAGIDGDVIVTPIGDGKLEIRDNEGLWLCDPSMLSCTNIDTGEIKEAEQ